MKRYVYLVISLLFFSGCIIHTRNPATRMRSVQPDAVPLEVQEGLRKLDLRMKVEKVIFLPGWD